MNITLNWTPGAGATSQAVQYKLSTAGTWTTHSTVGGAVATASITGLSNNLIYDFRVVTNCSGGSPAPSNNTQQINIICPTVNESSTDTTIDYSFNHLGGSVTAYTVALLDAAGTTVLQTQTPSVTSVISGIFSGLSPAVSYNIRVTVTAGSFNKVCDLVPVSTVLTPTCNAPTGVTATLDEIIPT